MTIGTELVQAWRSGGNSAEIVRRLNAAPDAEQRELLRVAVLGLLNDGASVWEARQFIDWVEEAGGAVWK